MPNKYIRMAIVYDFDGTLAPGNMQEHQFIPDVGMKPKKFWEEVRSSAKDRQADEILMYMKLMLEKADEKKVPVRKDDFKARGREIKLFDGVNDWFNRIQKYGKSKGVRIEHYLVSSGNTEIIEGTKIASKFKKIYASKFAFDHNGVAAWPALAINYTTKTQYLFRINKGALDLSDNDTINRFVKQKDGPIPFKNMVYIGDGSTDVPCFRLVKDQGGLAIAVFKPHTQNARKKADQYRQEGRVHCVVPADYNEGKELDCIIKSNIDLVAAREELSKLVDG